MGGKKLLLVTMFAAVIISSMLLIIHYKDARGYAAPAQGCLSCHEGISVINPKMQPYLLTFAIELFGKADGYECAVCHKGNPASKEKEIAHLATLIYAIVPTFVLSSRLVVAENLLVTWMLLAIYLIKSSLKRKSLFLIL